MPFDKLCLLCNVPTAWSTLHSQSAGRISNYPSGLSINVTFLWNLSLYPWQEYDFLPLCSYSNLYIYLPWNLSKHIIVACLCTLSLFDSPAVLWGSAMHGLYIVQLFLPGDKQRASDRVSSKLMLEIFLNAWAHAWFPVPNIFQCSQTVELLKIFTNFKIRKLSYVTLWSNIPSMKQ